MKLEVYNAGRGELSHDQRQHARKLCKICVCGCKICWCTDRQTDRHAHHNTNSPTGDGVMEQAVLRKVSVFFCTRSTNNKLIFNFIYSKSSPLLSFNMMQHTLTKFGVSRVKTHNRNSKLTEHCINKALLLDYCNTLESCVEANERTAADNAVVS